MVRARPVVGIVAVVIVACASPSGPNAPPPTTPPATASPSASAVSSQSPSQSSSAPAGTFALPKGSEQIVLDPAMFAGVAIDNPFWPMKPGSRWIYRETDADATKQRVEVTVTTESKQIAGITATVVHDIVTEGKDVVEDTRDWYAQDRLGNLWYLGEDTKEYENGKVTSTAGSWQAGVDGAQAGIILPAMPEVGLTYRQEFYAGEAEDEAEVLSVDESVEVPFGKFDGVLQTKERTPLEPKVVEQKFYARGIGEVKAVQVSGGTSLEVLLSFEPGG